MVATLSFHQERFALEYLKDQNASAAAARAGYTASNLASAGSELMKNPAIRDRVRLEMQNILAEARCTALDLMKARMRAAHFRVDKVIAPGWQLRPLEEIDEETRLALEVSTVLRRGVPELRLKQPDRHQALRALERVHEKLERLEQQENRRLEKAGALPTLEEIDAAEVAAEAQRLAAESSEKRQEMSGSAPAAAPLESAVAKKHQELSGCAAVAPVDDAGAESIFAKKHSCLLSSEFMPVAAGLQTTQKDQDFSGSAARAAEAGRARFAEKAKDLSGSGGVRRPRLSPLVASMLAGLRTEGRAPPPGGALRAEESAGCAAAVG